MTVLPTCPLQGMCTSALLDCCSPVVGCTTNTHAPYRKPVHVCTELVRTGQALPCGTYKNAHGISSFSQLAGPTPQVPYCPKVFPLNIFDNQIKYYFTLDVILKDVIYMSCSIVSLCLASGFYGLSPLLFPTSTSEPFSVPQNQF